MSVPEPAVDAKQLHDMCTRYGVARLEVFGSVSRGNAASDSDIDVLYELAPRARLGWDIEKLAAELSALLGRGGSTSCLATRCTGGCARRCCQRLACCM